MKRFHYELISFCFLSPSKALGNANTGQIINVTPLINHNAPYPTSTRIRHIEIRHVDVGCVQEHARRAALCSEPSFRLHRCRRQVQFLSIAPVLLLQSMTGGRTCNDLVARGFCSLLKEFETKLRHLFPTLLRTACDGQKKSRALRKLAPNYGGAPLTSTECWR